MVLPKVTVTKRLRRVSLTTRIPERIKTKTTSQKSNRCNGFRRLIQTRHQKKPTDQPMLRILTKC